MEVWKEVEDRGHKLNISSLGRVHITAKSTTFHRAISGQTKTFTATFKERILSPQKSGSGYLEVALVHKRRRYRFLVHRLVAMAFVPGFKVGKVVNHLDGDKLNNDPSNLEWVTPGENTIHAWKAELVQIRGEQSPRAILTEQRVRHILKFLAKGYPMRSLAIIAGVSSATILKIRDRKSWKHLKMDSMFRPLP